MEMYEVGGCVRDEILGLRSKDIDFTVVLGAGDITTGEHLNAWEPFEVMEALLRLDGFQLIDKARKPEFLTARGFFPADHAVYPRRAADFVLARDEKGYSDGRRPDEVKPGTLEDDLRRRDFTMNAIAKDSDGNLIDPFNGQADISKRLIRAVGNPHERLSEDALRAVRALRFSLTKKMRIEGELDKVLHFDMQVLDAVANKISDERIQEELNRMFAFDTMKTLRLLQKYPALTEAMFNGSISLEATMKRRKGK